MATVCFRFAGRGIFILLIKTSPPSEPPPEPENLDDQMRCPINSATSPPWRVRYGCPKQPHGA